MSDIDLDSFAKLGSTRLLVAAASVPLWEYGFICATIFGVIFYRFVDFQLISHFFTGDSAKLVYSTESDVAKNVLQKMTFERFWPTPWLCSSHLQTMFLHFFAIPPAVKYRRELLTTVDGGTLGLDWADPLPDGSSHLLPERDNTPIVLIIPGLTSDSKSQYVMHAVDAALDKGWRAAVANHRGLGGVPLTSKAFYNAGWTQDVRFVLHHIEEIYPSAPVAALGTSLGANMLVKYLGEEGNKTSIFAAAAVGCPWDLVVVDRWLGRNSKQKIYGSGLIYGLKEFAHMHKASFSKMVDWDFLNKARTVREFDDRITRLLGKFETVDTYYRRCSSAQFLPGVAVPLLGISALDDPICTREAIPWDECRANPNIILGVTSHGGHLAYLEGITASRIWWARHTMHFFKVVLDSPSLLQKKQGQKPVKALPSSVNTSPFVELSTSTEGTSSVASAIPLLVKTVPTFEPVNGGYKQSELEDDDDEIEGESGEILEQKDVNEGLSRSSPIDNTIQKQQESEDRPLISGDVQEERVLATGVLGEGGIERGNVGNVIAGGVNESEMTSENELVVRVGGREEMEVLESVLVNLLKAVRTKSKPTHRRSQNETLINRTEVDNFLAEENGFSSSSSIASSAVAIAKAAASVVESASVVMSMVQSVNRTEGGGGRRAPETLRRYGQNYVLSRGSGGSNKEGELYQDEEVKEEAGPSGTIGGSSGIVGRADSIDKVTLLAEVFGQGLGRLEAQNRTNAWLMAYVALSTSCPLLVTALVCRAYLKNGGNKAILGFFK